MKKSKFSEEQIATVLRQVDAGAPMPEVTRKLGISEATYYVWRIRYGQMAGAEIRRLRQLEEENRKLKQLVADLTLDKVNLQEVLAKKPDAHAQTRAGADRYRSLLDRRAASVWAAEIESGVVVLPPSWAGRYRASPTVAGVGPGPARDLAISACTSCCDGRGGW